MSFNLINQISIEDKKRIENYIELYGTSEGFIGLDAWLKHWSDNKIKMYKLLGNQLIYRTPFEYNKSEDELHTQMRELVSKYDIRSIIYDWYYRNKDFFPEKDRNEIRWFLLNCVDTDTLLKDSISANLKFKFENANKTFQIQAGAKPLRALGRFLTYCKDIPDVGEITQNYEKFRIAHSMVLNDKSVKGTLAISIHPLDFMTMSDNNSDWQSCMSWIQEGCYHVGTIEMMNSNNVLCCYIENTKPFYFSKDEEIKTEEYEWNNKRWRQLVYFTKDIIVSGKPYPYMNDEISKAIIEIIRGLAKDNLGWIYSFGPERYKDMIHINGNYSMNRAKRFIYDKNTKKFNILFDTKGMYNDMLNDSETHYWCVRNKVKHTKVISYSGKAPCLCCGGQIIEVGEDPDDDYSEYNERYYRTGESICSDCVDKRFRCDVCREINTRHKHYDVIIDGKPKRICKECIENYVRECPGCGQIMLTSLFNNSYYGLNEIDRNPEYIKFKIDFNEDELVPSSTAYPSRFEKEKAEKRFKTVYPICRCKECSNVDNSFEVSSVLDDSFWYHRTAHYNISKNIEDKAEWENFFPYNLKKVSPRDGLNISR